MYVYILFLQIHTNHSLKKKVFQHDTGVRNGILCHLGVRAPGGGVKYDMLLVVCAEYPRTD